MAIKALQDENELLAKIAVGDSRAFAIVYEHYRKRVYTVSLQYLRSELQAEDAVQEVFLKLWRLEEHLTAVKHLESYLMQLTKHKCLNMLRRSKLESLHMEPMPEEFDAPDSDTEDQILLNDTRKVVADGIALLPPQQQLVYNLCQVEGLKYDEVAAQLQLSPETVRTHLKLALRFLRGYVSKHTDVAALLIIFKIL